MSDDPNVRILAALDRLEAKLSTVEAGLTRLRSDVMARIDRLQDTVTALRDDIAVNFGAA